MRWLLIPASLLAATAARAEEPATEPPQPRAIVAVPSPFRCDSLLAEDCFDMYRRLVTRPAGDRSKDENPPFSDDSYRRLRPHDDRTPQ